MKTCIAILRGINVSGHNLIKMSALTELFITLGFDGPKTYIQSGNVVFGSLEDPGLLARRISDGIRNAFGFEVPVLVFSRDSLQEIATHNPFLLQRSEDISKLHVTFLEKTPAQDRVALIDAALYHPDEFALLGNAVYLFCPNGYGNTKLSNTFLEKKLQVQATTRNWKTVLELIRLSGQAG